MTETQLEFFRRLNAPFGKDDLYSVSKGGRNLTYVKAPVLMNRLDDVCGPAGWDVEYRPTERGYTCRVGILVPTGADGTAVWHYKEDGGGFEGMTKKVGGDNVADEDNDEKSAYTNAFRRACYAWGLSRDLWRCGIPAYLNREAVYHDVPAPAPAPAPRAAAPAANSQSRYNQAPAPAKPQGQGNYDNFKPPTKQGKAAYAFLKGLETHFGSGVVKIADEIAKQNGLPYKAFEWDEQSLEVIMWGVIDEIKHSFENYQGEFDHLEDPRLGG